MSIISKETWEKFSQDLSDIDTIKEIQEYLIMKERQDKLWNDLSEESKGIVKNTYGNIDSALNGKVMDAEGLKHFMNTLFGTHNLTSEKE